MKMRKTPFHHQANRLLDKLAAARRLQVEDTEPANALWRQDLMRSIRGIGPIEAKGGNDLFANLSWKLAPAAAILLVFLTLWISRLDNALEFQIASLVVSDPAQTDVYTPLYAFDFKREPQP